VGGSTTAYGYDGEGRRVQKVGPGGTTVYVYDAWDNWRRSTRRAPGAGDAVFDGRSAEKHSASNQYLRECSGI